MPTAHRLLCLLGLCLTAHTGLAAAQTAPSPALSPAEVVTAQLTALRTVDNPSPDAGMAIVFAFASPGNRAQTGPLPRFSRMVRQGYGGLVNNRGASIEDVAVEDDTAFVATKVVAQSGQVLTYVFILARGPHEGCDGCWMTDGVAERPSDAAGGELAT